MQMYSMIALRWPMESRPRPRTGTWVSKAKGLRFSP